MSSRLLVFCLVLPSALFALPLPGRNLDDPIAPGSAVTYAKLLRLICPDLAVRTDDPGRATATHAPEVRELGKRPQPADGELSGKFEIESVKTVALLPLPRLRALVTFALNSEDSQPDRLVGLFELTPSPRLVDIVSVPGFPDDPGDYESRIRLNPGTDAYRFDAYHSNSSQGYQLSTILFVRGDRIEKVLDVALLSSRGEDAAHSFTETLELSSVPDPGGRYAGVLVRVTFKREADEPESQHRPRRPSYRRFYSATYRWDPAARQFRTTSREVLALEAFNLKEY